MEEFEGMDVLAMLKAGKFETDPEQKARNERANKAAAKAERMPITEVAEYLESLKDGEAETFEAVANVAKNLTKCSKRAEWMLNTVSKREADGIKAAIAKIEALTA